ncbi:glycosyltransferase [Enterovibrio nigricans]|uniref:Glycosyltransferase involved in cell wall bisynthesis n=1 Tax=Enterovibrio nigricans DSM 22720 TaxID=1121868 RepID=A0A1T4V816_9GAMM|nr:glycosyltransferase [Enterovibrio nigricans]PKF49094.1 hypothetical protein AT251_21415 [Enterovibrio nigricans]SKA61077.1 Glycosyltransferase involved in cell wall bisynthesis [Enterovibrio nigricans DSM 22720]
MSAVTSTHICHIVSTYKDDVLNQQLLSNISCSMSKDYEHTLVVLSSQPSQRFSLPDGVSCIELKNKKPLCLRSFRECKKVLSLLKPDVCHTYGEAPLAMQWLAHRSGVPVKLHQLSSSQALPCQNWIKKTFLSVLSHSTDVFITASANAQHWLESNLGLSPEQCQIIRPAINAQRYRPALQEVDPHRTNSFLGTVAIPTNKFVVGTNINDQHLDSVINLIDEFAVASKLSPAFKKHAMLLIAGNARFLPLLRKEIQVRNLGEDVCILGELPNYWLFYKVIDALISPTEIDTTTALHLEAMAMAVPIISLRSRKLEKRSEHPLFWTDKNGHCRIQHQLLEIFTDMNKRLRLGREARLYVQEKHCVKEYELRLKALYQLARPPANTSYASTPHLYASTSSKRE